MAPITLANAANFVDVMLATEAALANKPMVMHIDMALMIARQCVKETALKNIAALIEGEVQMLYDMHVAELGELPVGAKLFQIETWVEKLEANWLALVDEYGSVLSAHWLGTADTKTPRSAAEVQGVCASFASEVYKNITYVHDKELPREKTDVELLADIGITREHVDTLIRNRQHDINHNARHATEEVQDMKYELKAAIELLNANATMLGLTGAALHDIIDNASDADDGLSNSGLTQLGMPTDAPTRWVMRDIKQHYGVEHFAIMVETGNYAPRQDQPPAAETTDQYEYATAGDGKPIRKLAGGQWEYYEPVASVAAAPAPAPLPPPAVPVAQYEFATASDGKTIRRLQSGGDWEYYTPLNPDPVQPAPAPKRPSERAMEAVADAKAADVAGTIPAEALKAIKDFTSLKGEDLGGGLGVSRATFDNYTKGKGAKLQATEANKAFLLKHVDEHIASLQFARNAIASA